MSYIQVDARGCGAGKTRSTIVPRIKQNLKDGIRTLLVVPGINLQKEYLEHFTNEELTIINRENGQDRILQQYQLADTPVVCLTHEGFIRIPSGFLERMNWDLIIDEAIIPYSQTTFKTSDSAGRVWVDFSEVFRWQDPEQVPDSRPQGKYQEHYELSVVQSTPPDIIDSNKWQKLSNPNWRIWATWNTGNNLMTGGGETSTLYMEISDSILDGWSSVWIAAAAFDRTLMGHWMRANNIPYETVYDFEVHQSPVHWHMPTEMFSWSKGCRKANPLIESEFKAYCERHRTGRLIYNKNNDSDTVFENGERIPHNAHGMNRHKDKTDYAFLSAIKPSNGYKNFLWQRAEFSMYKEKAQACEAFEFAFSGYGFYQLLMRTALRDPANTSMVNIFALDSNMILSVMDLFSSKTYQVSSNISVKDQRTTRVPLTPAEKQRRYRERQKILKNTP